MENFKQSDPFISNYHPNPRISALDPVYTNPDIRVNKYTVLKMLDSYERGFSY